ncbi:hypothetical protein AAC387_Pa08g2447 [Persea americana]
MENTLPASGRISIADLVTVHGAHRLLLQGYSHVEMWLLKVVVGRWFWNVVSKCFEGFEDVSAALHSPDEEANNNNTSNKLGGHVGFWKPFIKTV